MTIDMRIAAGALAIACVFAAGVHAQDDDLPAGPAKTAVVDACTSCHDAGTFTSERHSAADWSGIVTQMESMGLSLTDEQHGAIVAYLALADREWDAVRIWATVLLVGNLLIPGYWILLAMMKTGIVSF